jgi:hypothetical protein
MFFAIKSLVCPNNPLDLAQTLPHNTYCEWSGCEACSLAAPLYSLLREALSPIPIVRHAKITQLPLAFSHIPMAKCLL